MLHSGLSFILLGPIATFETCW